MRPCVDMMTVSEIHLTMTPDKSHLYLEIDDLQGHNQVFPTFASLSRLNRSTWGSALRPYHGPCHEHLASVAFSKICMPEFEELVTQGHVVVGCGKIDIVRSCCPRRIRNLEQAELRVILFSEHKDCAPMPSLTSTTIEPSGFPCRT